MAAGRAATDGDEVGVAPVLGDVLLDPGQGPLAVDDVVGPRRLGAQPVVDRDAHPAPGHQLEHHRLALLALVADDPGPAVDVHHDRRLGGWGQAGPVDVEAVALAAVAPVVDVAVVLDRRATGAGWPGSPATTCPRSGRSGGRAPGRPGCAPRPARRRPPGPPAWPVTPSPTRPIHSAMARARPSQPAQPSRAPTQMNRAGGDHLPDDVLEGQLAGDPGQGEARRRSAAPAGWGGRPAARRHPRPG